MVLAEKFMSLKHSVPCNLFVVLEIYTENPKKDRAKQLEEPKLEIKIGNNQYADTPSANVSYTNKEMDDRENVDDKLSK